MNDEELLQMLEGEQGDAFNCGLVISNPAGFNLIQANYAVVEGELTIDPKRYWHQGAHQLEEILNKYRQTGYRVEWVGQDGSDTIYTIIRTHLLLSSDNLVRMILHWMNQVGFIPHA